jgi:23S rRNA (cytidine1920-2'-O)/16S rRNA (cytidine1409-2'-O)-methyltransferase
VLERTNVRDLTPGSVPFRPQLVAVDLSFISLGLALPPLAALADANADFVLLVKPQFEAGRTDVGRGGVVRDPEVWRRVLIDIANACGATDLGPQDVMASPLLGPAGNAEFLVHAARGSASTELDVDAAVREADALRSAS